MPKLPTTRIEAARIKRGLSRLDMANALGISQSTYYRIELGKSQSSHEVGRLLFEYFEGEVPLGDIYDPIYGASIKPLPLDK